MLFFSFLFNFFLFLFFSTLFNFFYVRFLFFLFLLLHPLMSFMQHSTPFLLIGKYSASNIISRKMPVNVVLFEASLSKNSEFVKPSAPIVRFPTDRCLPRSSMRSKTRVPRVLQSVCCSWLDLSR